MRRAPLRELPGQGRTEHAVRNNGWPKSRLEVLSGARGSALFDVWRAVPMGTEVLVTKDDGLEYPTRTRSAPWTVADRTPLILLEGITGGYALSRVRLPTDERRVHLASRGRDEAGCKAVLTRRDVLTWDLERVTCKRCQKALANLLTPRHFKTCDWIGCGGCAPRTAEGTTP
jgi:hypothetical protein